MSEDLTLREGSQFGELPTDLRNLGPEALSGSPPLFTFEADGYATNGGAERRVLNSIPPPISTAETFRAISYLSRANFESFRSLRFFGRGTQVLSPSSGTTYVTIASVTIPPTWAGVVTSFGQWIGDPTAYNKPDGSQDDISWKIIINDSTVFNYDGFPYVISSLDNPAKLFIPVGEGNTISIQATNNMAVGSFGAKDLAVKAVLFGHQFPLDEIDDVFRNK